MFLLRVVCAVCDRLKGGSLPAKPCLCFPLALLEQVIELRKKKKTKEKQVDTAANICNPCNSGTSEAKAEVPEQPGLHFEF